MLRRLYRLLHKNKTSQSTFLPKVRVLVVNLSQGKAKFVQVNGDFELIEFKLVDSK